MPIIKCCGANWDSQIEKCPRCEEHLRIQPKPPTPSGEGSDAATCSVDLKCPDCGGGGNYNREGYLQCCGYEWNP